MAESLAPPFSSRRLSRKLFRLIPWIALLGLLFFNVNILIRVQGVQDFGSFIASGQAARRGEDPYGVYPLTSREVIQGVTHTYPNLNPPISIFFFETLANVDPGRAYRLWVFFSICLYLLCLVPLIHLYHPSSILILWSLNLAGLWNNLILGQIYVPLLACVVAAWYLLRKDRFYLAGIFIGILVSFKPNLVLWPVLLFLAGFRKPALSAIGTVLILSLLPAIRYGPAIYLDWYRALSLTSWFDLPHYASFMSITSRLGIPWLGIPLVIGFVGVLAWWAWKKRPSSIQITELALLGSVLISPLSSPRFTLFLIPIFFSRVWSLPVKIAGILLLVPTIFVIYLGLLSPASKILFGLVYPAAIFLLFWELVRSNPGQIPDRTD